MRYTPQGTAVCTFGLATNRSWTTDSGEKREDTEFHRVVAWNKLAELCSQLLFKGRKVYVEGRLQTRSWTSQDGNQRQTTEIIIEEMIILDSRQMEPVGETIVGASVKENVPAAPEEIPIAGEGTPPAEEEKVDKEEVKEEKKVEGQPAVEETAKPEEVNAGDIPF